LITVLAVTAASARAEAPRSCQKDPARLAAAAALLERLERADQADRTSGKPWDAVAKRDLSRRQMVARLFAEGCLSTAKDYSNAALIFQHGDVEYPEHFFQAFLFAKKAVELGSTTDKDMMANGINRYLVKSGRRQLFGSQGSTTGPGVCYCLDQYERSFPESLRVAYKGKTIEQELDWLDQVNAAQGLACPRATECAAALAPSPAGTVPGFW
jgi:hypothetical protein